MSDKLAGAEYWRKMYEDEKVRFDWWVRHAAIIDKDGSSFTWYRDKSSVWNWEVEPIRDGGIEAAIDRLMKGE